MDYPHPERHRDSYTTTDFESVHFEPKQTTGPEFYSRSKLSRRVGLVGVGFAALFGVFFICAGVIIPLQSTSALAPHGFMTVFIGSWEREFISLALNLIVTACTEATGFVHGIALRSALASERRLRFNTNLRLLSAASGWFNPNGLLCNIMMAILLIVSYNSSVLLTMGNDISYTSTTSERYVIFLSKVPLVVLGVALLLQVTIALSSVRCTHILTSSSSSFDITAALVHHAQILPEPGRCMHGVADEGRQGPVKPSAKQSSAWGAHKGVRKVVMTLWLLVIICVVCGVIFIVSPFVDKQSGTWSFFPQTFESSLVFYTISSYGTSMKWYHWVLYYTSMAVIQGPLTLVLHCSELVVNVIRDEGVWRKATTKKGMTISSHPLSLIFGMPLSVALLVSKPFLHWMLGLAVNVVPAWTAMDLEIWIYVWSFQILNYSAALFIFSLALTVVALLRPSGPQPAAYGHIQTLANLIDEWSPTMWWGHKSPGHAGTSNVQLGEVDMNALYG